MGTPVPCIRIPRSVETKAQESPKAPSLADCYQKVGLCLLIDGSDSDNSRVTHRACTRLHHVNGTMLLLGPSPGSSCRRSSCRYRATGPLLAVCDSTSGRPPKSSPAPPPPSLGRLRSLGPGPARLELPLPPQIPLADPLQPKSGRGPGPSSECIQGHAES